MSFFDDYYGEFPDDIDELEALWDLPSPGDSEHHDHSDSKAQRGAMFEYAYAKRDQLEAHIASGEAVLRQVQKDIVRLQEEEHQELRAARSLLRRAIDRRAR